MKVRSELQRHRGEAAIRTLPFNKKGLNMKKLKDQRLAILVDAENLEISAFSLHKARIDYERLLEKLNGREIVRVIYYQQRKNWINGKASGFQRYLEELGVEIRLTEKNADCYLTIDSVSLADKADTIAILGGDGDYLPLIRYLKFRGVRTEIWMWPEATSTQLRAEADVFVPLSTDVLRDENQGR